MLADHYAILGLPPSATKEEIKTAYRKLARVHHPDLNQSDCTAADRFRAIQLAYETLSRPGLRQAYLEKRWYAQFRNEPMQSEPLTIEQILQQCIELERFTSTLDPYRMDRAGLRAHIKTCITKWRTINISQQEDVSIIEAILTLIKRASKELSFQDCKELHQQLGQWLGDGLSDRLLKHDWLTARKKQESQQRWWPVWMGLITLVLAAIIWFSAR
jgi:curved DNA-binding protein CbpA